jgi:hypothetical protein
MPQLVPAFDVLRVKRHGPTVGIESFVCIHQKGFNQVLEDTRKKSDQSEDKQEGTKRLESIMVAKKYFENSLHRLKVGVLPSIA